jgi:hypothetical protein
MRHTLVVVVSLILFFSPGAMSIAKADGDICTSSTAKDDYNKRIDNLLFDKVPSLMEDCGIGGLFDLCGMLGSTLGGFVGANCGSGGSGGGSGGAAFCDFGFDLDSAKKAYDIFGRAETAGEDNTKYASSDFEPIDVAFVQSGGEQRLQALDLVSDDGV